MKRKLMLNTITAIVLQITAVVSGLIIPRMIIYEYGSEVNGIVNSITQFLSIIAFLELGVGTVIQSNLYEPLANKDYTRISAIITSGDKFFKRIAYILIVYICVLIVVFPFINNSSFDGIYTATLIASIAISTFSQYYFGIIDRILLNADQRGYIQYGSQIITLILNTVACALLINSGASIQFVKLTTSALYLIRPAVLRLFINKQYKINRKATYKEEPIKQKWNGFAQHAAAVVLDNTDTLVLTIFSTLVNVSIYSVYHLVIYGVKQLFISTTHGIQAYMGNLLARKNESSLARFFDISELVIHTGTVLLFTCTGVLMLPFISIYTNGINDANYIQPVFSVVITLAHAMHCLRLPYNLLIQAAGHFKQTQHNYIIAASLNLIISTVTVSYWGLIGVAIGTLVAMLYQTIWMSVYVAKYLVKRTIQKFIKQICFDVVNVIIIILLTKQICLADINYYSWVQMSIKVVAISLGVIITTSVIGYKGHVKDILSYIKYRS